MSTNPPTADTGKGENVERFNSRVAAIAFGVGVGFIGAVILYPLLTGRLDNATMSNMSLTSLGAALMLISKGSDWFMRGRVTAPTTSGTGDGATATSTTTTTVPPTPPGGPVVVETRSTGVTPPTTDPEA